MRLPHPKRANSRVGRSQDEERGLTDQPTERTPLQVLARELPVEYGLLRVLLSIMRQGLSTRSKAQRIRLIDMSAHLRRDVGLTPHVELPAATPLDCNADGTPSGAWLRRDIKLY